MTSYKANDSGYMNYRLILFLFFTHCLVACLKSANDQTEDLTELKKQELTALLNRVYEDDLKYRGEVASYIEKYGIRSPEIKALSKKINTVDSLNIIVVKEIVNKYGWLSKDVVGEQANAALFLVIQHATKNDRKYFLPLVRAAVKNNSASAKDLAFLEDRMAEEEGRKQIYGTQIGFDEKTNKYFVLPIENPKQVDDRRAKVGLPPLSVQLSQWQIEPR